MASILLVDDDEQFRKMLSEVLRRAGYEVQEASDGSHANKIYSNHPTDLIITDLIMPEKEGLETICDFHKNYPGVKIIAISGGNRCGPANYLKMAKAFGALHVLAKPFFHKEILDAVRSALEA